MPAPSLERVAARRRRAADANHLITLIGRRGRKFFFSAANDRYAFLEVAENGRIWFNDEYTGARIYTHKCAGSRIRGFSHGGTLWCLVKKMCRYVATGEPIDVAYIAPSIWGYPASDAAALRIEVTHLPIIRSTP